MSYDHHFVACVHWQLSHGWNVHELAIKIAFLKGDLHEEVYVMHPRGFVQKGQVCRLKKALYGLKQASHA